MESVCRVAVLLELSAGNKVRCGETPQPTRGTRMLPGEESNASRWGEGAVRGRRLLKKVRAVPSFRRAAEKSTRAGRATRRLLPRPGFFEIDAFMRPMARRFAPCVLHCYGS